MKRILFILTITFGLATAGYSQSINLMELGLRFGGSADIGIDATIPLAAKPRLHPTFSFGNRSAMLGAYFDWLFPVSGASGFKLYPGIGPELYFVPNNVEVGVAGNFGMEYSFDFPLTVGFDWRPTIIVTDGVFYAGNWGFMGRFRFK